MRRSSSWESVISWRNFTDSMRPPTSHPCPQSCDLYAHSLCNASTRSVGRFRRNIWFSFVGASGRISLRSFHRCLLWIQLSPCADISSLCEIKNYETQYLPRIVKFLISCFTSGAKYLRHVGHVKIFEVRKSIRQFWQNVCPHWRILGILSLSL